MNNIALYKKFRELHKKSNNEYETARKYNPRAWQNAVLKVKRTKVPTTQDTELSLRFSEELKLNIQLEKLGLPRSTKVSLLRYPDGKLVVFYPQRFGMGSFHL